MSLASLIVALLGSYFRRRIVIYAIILSLFGLGAVSGAIAVSVVQDDTRAQLSEFMDGYLVGAGASDEYGTSRPMIVQEILQGAVIPFVLGLTVLGAPIVLGIVFLKGFALGFTLVFLFDELSYRGLLLMLAGIVPHSLLKIPALLLASGAAITFSLAAAKVLIGHRNGGGVWGQLATTAAMTAASVFMIAGGTWIQASVSPILISTVVGYIRG